MTYYIVDCPVCDEPIFTYQNDKFWHYVHLGNKANFSGGSPLGDVIPYWHRYTHEIAANNIQGRYGAFTPSDIFIDRRKYPQYLIRYPELEAAKRVLEICRDLH